MHAGGPQQRICGRLSEFSAGCAFPLCPQLRVQRRQHVVRHCLPHQNKLRIGQSHQSPTFLACMQSKCFSAEACTCAAVHPCWILTSPTCENPSQSKLGSRSPSGSWQASDAGGQLNAAAANSTAFVSYLSMASQGRAALGGGGRTSMSKAGRQPQSARAGESSTDCGQERAIASRKSGR